MKKSLALVLAILILAVMSAPKNAAAYTKPAELFNAMDVGIWGELTPGVDCDPGLEGAPIKEGVYLYGLFDSEYMTISEPSTISGYTKVASPEEMTDGTFAVYYASSGFGYVLVMGEPDADGAGGVYKKPSELSRTFDVGVWPLRAGTYDPGLDGNNIKNGVFVYGLFDSSYAQLSPPNSVSGYTKVNTPSEMTDGTYCVLTASSGYSYVLIMGVAGANGEPVRNTNVLKIVVGAVTAVVVLSAIVALNIKARKIESYA